MEFLNKSIKLTANQFKIAEFAHRVAGKVLVKASPNDKDSPLEVTVGELMEVAGSELTGN